MHRWNLLAATASAVAASHCNPALAAAWPEKGDCVRHQPGWRGHPSSRFPALFLSLPASLPPSLSLFVTCYSQGLCPVKLPCSLKLYTHHKVFPDPSVCFVPASQPAHRLPCCFSAKRPRWLPQSRFFWPCPGSFTEQENHSSSPESLRVPLCHFLVHTLVDRTANLDKITY